MRILAASNYVGEASVESYIATPLTQTMTMPPIESAVRFTSVLSRLQSAPTIRPLATFANMKIDLQLRPRLPMFPKNARLF